MSRQETEARKEAYRVVQAALQDWEIGYIDRPLLIYDRGPDGRPTQVEKRRHIDLLFDRISGYRILRADADPEAFDAAARTARRFYVPCKLHTGQVETVLDRTHKSVGFFAGERYGKTHAMAQRAIDSICLLGGADLEADGQVIPHLFAWVAPTMEHTRIGVAKLRALLPAELIDWYPPRKTTTDQTIYLADGSQIHIRYASKEDGSNLKGFPYYEMWWDELASVKHAENWHVGQGRLVDHDGQALFASSPTPGSVAEELIVTAGMRRDEICDQEPDAVYTTGSCFENPWQTIESIERRIRAGGGEDEPAVRRGVFGEWVGDGELLWREFSPRRHLIEGPSRDCEGWGCTNINKIVFATIFGETDSDLRYVGGTDFNLWPFTTLVCQVGVKDREDQNDPANWHLFVIDEIQKKARSEYDFARFVAGTKGPCAADYRKLPRDTFAAMAMVCDGTSAYPAPHMAGHGESRASTARWQAFKECGFHCEPPAYTATGHPTNPTQKDRNSLLHKLFIEDRIHIHGTRCDVGPYSLIKSLKTQKRREDGTAEKRSGQASDRKSSSTDALGYVTWAAFADHILQAPAATVISW
jgi:hypothetical protein